MELVQRTDFINALNKDYSLSTLTQLLLNQLDKPIANIIITNGMNYPDVLQTVVQKAIEEGWIANLVYHAITQNPNGVNLKAFVQKHPDFDAVKGAPISVDWVMAHTLRARRYFIDRKDLRVALKELRSSDGPRVLVVTGERVTGKSYTNELIAFLSERTPKNKTIYMNLDKYVYEAPNLTEMIGLQMGMDTTKIPQQQDEQKARWVQRLVGWILNRVVNPGDTTYWFVFDGFREQTLLPETKDWIDELAVQAETNVPQCRVVLLNYQETLPFQISDYVSREEIKPIGRDELIEFFGLLNVDHKGNYSPEDLSSKVDLLIAKVDAAIAVKPENQIERLRVLSKAVKETAGLLFV
ncbi:MAG TPA: effector-associated domain EAD1-containing protein [Pyrinomonadaceae bacterium]|nr:effector-associated domain EAD1-containing protein [Pyrinomonadaceae bacterium]